MWWHTLGILGHTHWPLHGPLAHMRHAAPRSGEEATMEHAWGAAWTRDGLDRKTRSIVTVSMLIALGAHGALKGHVRGALNNGVSQEEIREIIIHAATYCGYPAALAAMKVAREVIDAHQD